MKYLYAVALALLLCLGLYAYIESERADSLKADNKVLMSKVEASEAARKKEQQDAIDANNRAKQTQIEKQVISDEAQKNRDCIANGTCGVRVVFKSAICAGVHETTVGGSSVDGAASQELRDFAQWYVDLEAAIKDNLLQIKKLQEDVAIRSNPNYCQAKL
jgi:hypothetical protein